MTAPIRVGRVESDHMTDDELFGLAMLQCEPAIVEALARIQNRFDADAARLAAQAVEIAALRRVAEAARVLHDTYDQRRSVLIEEAYALEMAIAALDATPKENGNG